MNALPPIPTFRPCLGREELDAVRDVFESRWLGMGPATKRFEDAIAAHLGVGHALGVNSGTAALQLALNALDLKPGSEVIVPSLTFIATAQAIVNAGLTPVFCEVEPETLNLDVDDALARRTPRTRAIMPVHYAGVACDIDRLMEATRDEPVAVIEDAAHAFGSTSKGRPLGAIGDLGCFSFNAIKNITCGEGGAVVTDQDDLAEHVRRSRVLGMDKDGWRRQKTDRPWAYRTEGGGYRMHMSDINAAIGLAQLQKLEEFRTRKLDIVHRYDDAFCGMAGLTPLQRTDETFPFSYVVRIDHGRRDELATFLRERGVLTLVQFTPNHLQPSFQAHRQPLPKTEQLFDEIITLPFFVELADSDVQRVIDAVHEFFERSPSSDDSAAAPEIISLPSGQPVTR